LRLLRQQPRAYAAPLLVLARPGGLNERECVGVPPDYGLDRLPRVPKGGHKY